MNKTRRKFLKNTAALPAIAAGAYAWPSMMRSAFAAFPLDKLKQEIAKHRGETLVFSTWGGSTEAGFRDGYWTQFSKEFGVKIIEDSPPSLAKIIAMIDAGNVTWDVCDVASFKAYKMGIDGFAETFDYSLVDTSEIPKETMTPWGPPSYSWAMALGYRSDVFTSNPPTSVNDFFDYAKYPGKRAMRDQPTMNIMYAAQAAGIPSKDIYPFTEDKIALAYKKLDEGKDNFIFWGSGAQSQQLLANKEVNMCLLWNGRVDKLIEDGIPLGLAFVDGQFATDSWLIPKGAPNKRLAELFISWYVHPENNANLSYHLSSGPVNTMAFDKADPKRKATLPTTYADQMTVLDVEFWGKNFDREMERWKQWRLS